MCSYPPGVDVVGSNMGVYVVVNVAGWIVPVGVKVQIGITSFIAGWTAPVWSWLNSMSSSSDTKKRSATLESVSLACTVYGIISQASAVNSVLVDCADGVGTDGTASGITLGVDGLGNINCQTVKKKAKNTRLIAAVRIVKKLCACFFWLFPRSDVIERGIGCALHFLFSMGRSTVSTSLISAAYA